MKLWGLSTEYGEFFLQVYYNIWFLQPLVLGTLQMFFFLCVLIIKNDMHYICFVDRLLFVINAIKEEIMLRVEDSSPRPTNMTETLERLIEETLGEN